MAADNEQVKREAMAYYKRLRGEPLDEARFSCNDCPQAPECEWAYDLYNIDGDCLAEK